MQSVRLKKIWIDEVDDELHVPTIMPKWNYGRDTKNMNETRAVLWKEFAKCLSHDDSNFWWMDLLGNAFNDPEIMNEIATLVRVNKRVRSKPHKSIADVLYVVDDASLCATNASHGWSHGHMGGALCEMECDLRMTGCVVDTYRLSDLLEIPLDQYKLIIFANAFLLNAQTFEQIRARLSKDALVVWVYAPGIASEGISFENVRALTGFVIEPNPRAPRTHQSIVEDFPLLRLLPQQGQRVLDCDEDGSVLAALRQSGEQREAFCAYPAPPPELWGELTRLASCKIHAPAGCTVYADSRFTAIFPSRHVRSFMLAAAGYPRVECVSGAVIPANTELKLAEATQMAYFIFADQA